MPPRRTLVPPKDETRISLSEASRLLADRGTPASHMSLWRWCVRGKRASHGPKIFLEAERVGRNLYTTPEAITRFVEQVTDEAWLAHQTELAV